MLSQTENAGELMVTNYLEGKAYSLLKCQVSHSVLDHEMDVSFLESLPVAFMLARNFISQLSMLIKVNKAHRCFKCVFDL